MFVDNNISTSQIIKKKKLDKNIIVEMDPSKSDRKEWIISFLYFHSKKFSLIINIYYNMIAFFYQITVIILNLIGFKPQDVLLMIF